VRAGGGCRSASGPAGTRLIEPLLRLSLKDLDELDILIREIQRAAQDWVAERRQALVAAKAELERSL